MAVKKKTEAKVLRVKYFIAPSSCSFCPPKVSKTKELMMIISNKTYRLKMYQVRKEPTKPEKMDKNDYDKNRHIQTQHQKMKNRKKHITNSSSTNSGNGKNTYQ